MKNKSFELMDLDHLAKINRAWLYKDLQSFQSFTRCVGNSVMAILASSFQPCHSKLKTSIKSATLKGNPFYQLGSNFTFANILRYK